MDGGNDGSLLDQWRYVLDAGALDWVGCCDHDNGAGREYSWWITQKLTDIFYTPGHFAPMFNYERSVTYPEGHRNVIFAQRGIRRSAAAAHHAADASRACARYADAVRVSEIVRRRRGVAHQRHQHGHGLARQRSAQVEPVVEIYQGDRQNYEMPDAPRSNCAKPTRSAAGGPKGL